MAKTVIDKAKELISELGKEGAIEHFNELIKEIGEPRNFEEICRISGLETAIDFINGKFD